MTGLFFKKMHKLQQVPDESRYSMFISSCVHLKRFYQVFRHLRLARICVDSTWIFLDLLRHWLAKPRSIIGKNRTDFVGQPHRPFCEFRTSLWTASGPLQVTRTGIIAHRQHMVQTRWLLMAPYGGRKRLRPMNGLGFYSLKATMQIE